MATPPAAKTQTNRKCPREPIGAAAGLAFEGRAVQRATALAVLATQQQRPRRTGLCKVHIDLPETRKKRCTPDQIP